MNKRKQCDKMVAWVLAVVLMLGISPFQALVGGQTVTVEATEVNYVSFAENRTLYFRVPDGKFYAAVPGNPSVEITLPGTSWDSGTNTLTLNNVTWTTAAAYALRIESTAQIGAVTLHLEGDNSFVSTFNDEAVDSSAGLYSSHGLTISGSGSLYLKSGNVRDRSAALWNYDHVLTVDGGTITANGGSGGRSTGIFGGSGTTVINGGDITATAGQGLQRPGSAVESCGISSDAGITVNGGRLNLRGIGVENPPPGNHVSTSAGFYTWGGVIRLNGGVFIASGETQAIAIDRGGRMEFRVHNYQWWHNSKPTEHDKTKAVTEFVNSPDYRYVELNVPAYDGEPAVGRLILPVWQDEKPATLTPPDVQDGNSPTSGQGWQISDNGTDGWTDFTDMMAGMEHDGKYLRYYAENEHDGGRMGYSNIVRIRVLPTDMREITVEMWDEYGDGWTNNGALRIEVNGETLVPNAKLEYGHGPAYYRFEIYLGDAVEFFGVSGEWFEDNAFAMYYSYDPPVPAFNPAANPCDCSDMILACRHYGNNMSWDNTLLDGFVVPVSPTTLDTPTAMSLNKDGTVTFTPGANNAAAGATFIFTLYKDGAAVTGFEGIAVTSGSVPDGIIAKMLEASGAYTVRVSAISTDVNYISPSAESDASAAVNVHALAVTIIGGNGTDSVNANTVSYTGYALGGDTVTLTASPATSRKVTWSGAGTGDANVRTITQIAANAAITAMFSEIQPLPDGTIGGINLPGDSNGGGSILAGDIVVSDVPPRQDLYNPNTGSDGITAPLSWIEMQSPNTGDDSPFGIYDRRNLTLDNWDEIKTSSEMESIVMNVPFQVQGEESVYLHMVIAAAVLLATVILWAASRYKYGKSVLISKHHRNRK